MMSLITVSTSNKVELQNITKSVQDAVNSARIDAGICYLFVPHTTAAIALADRSDNRIIEDIANQLENIVPPNCHYQHPEGNSPAHIKASLYENSMTLFIQGGELILGMWQGIFFCEFDGPKMRNVYVKIVPDTL